MGRLGQKAFGGILTCHDQIALTHDRGDVDQPDGAIVWVFWDGLDEFAVPAQYLYLLQVGRVNLAVLEGQIGPTGADPLHRHSRSRLRAALPARSTGLASAIVEIVSITYPPRGRVQGRTPLG